VFVEFIMLYKKESRDDFGNDRAIGLLCHSYKVLSVLILHRLDSERHVAVGTMC